MYVLNPLLTRWRDSAGRQSVVELWSLLQGERQEAHSKSIKPDLFLLRGASFSSLVAPRHEVLSGSVPAGRPYGCLVECCCPVHRQFHLPEYIGVYVHPEPYRCIKFTSSISSPSSSEASMVPQRDILSRRDPTIHQHCPTIFRQQNDCRQAYHERDERDYCRISELYLERPDLRRGHPVLG